MGGLFTLKKGLVMSQDNIVNAESLGIKCGKCGSDTTIDEAHQSYESLEIDYECKACGFCGGVVVGL